MPIDPADNHTGDHGNSFAEVVTRYLEQGLPDQEMARMNARLLADVQARDLFVRFVRLHGILSDRGWTIDGSATSNPLAAPGNDPFVDSLNDALIQPAIREDEFELAALNPEADAEVFTPAPWEPARQAATGRRAKPGRDRNLPIRSGIAAMLIFGITLFGWLWIRSGNRGTHAVSVQLPVTTGEATGAVVQPQVILGDAIDARFDTASDHLLPGGTMPGGAIFLKTGWIRVDFPTGVSAVVEAPAHFSVESGTVMDLESGRISADVPPAGHGFTIKAPLSTLVDLGTEFGVSVDAQGVQTVEVFKGSIRVDRPPAAGPEAGSIVLSQGMARAIKTSGAPSIPAPPRPAEFVRRAQFDGWVKTLALGDKAGITDRWRTYSEQLSRDPSVDLYYTFDDRDGSPNEIKNRACTTAGRYDIPMASFAPTWGEGRLPGTSSLNFDPAQQQRLILPSYPITTNGQMTAAAWVFARKHVTWGSIAKSWGNSRAGALHLGFLADTGCLEIELDGTVPGGPYVHDPDPFPLGRWVHVAFTSDGKTLRLYRDGKEVASVPSRPVAVEQQIKSLSFGVKTDDDGITPSPEPQCGFWDGQISEFALFHRALSPAEIARMSSFGPQ